MSWSSSASKYVDLVVNKMRETICKYDLQNMVTPLIWCFDTYPVLSVVACCVAFAYAVPICIFLAFGVITFLVTFIGFLFLEGTILAVAFMVLLSALSVLTVVCGLLLFTFWLLYITVLQICQALNLNENTADIPTEEFLNNLNHHHSTNVNNVEVEVDEE